MWTCSQCNETLEDDFKSCWKCANGGVEIDPVLGLPDLSDLTFVTTPSVPGSKVIETLGLVFGEAIIGANIINDAITGITDILGGRAGSYEHHLQIARKIAIAEMGQSAKERGANSVLGVDIDYETIRGTMLMVAASGTAARITKREDD